MRQVREVLRLTAAEVRLNEVARRVGVAPSTVRLTLKRLGRAGLSWPLPAEMTDGALETALFAAEQALGPSMHAPAALTGASAPPIERGMFYTIQYYRKPARTRPPGRRKNKSRV